MKNTTPHKIIRFRRWTRKGYAIFSSLGRCVTIGTLGREVADASLKKQKTAIPLNPIKTGGNVSYEEEMEDELPDGVWIGPGLVGLHLPTDETYCAAYNYYIKTKFNHISRKDTSCIPPAIFL